jgi:hypothetical protein
MEMYIKWALTTLISAFVGSFLAGYLKKKGENLATREDINELLKHVAAVTQTTKAIEAKISNDMWDRQARWSIKRDALFEVTRELASLMYALDWIHEVLFRIGYTTEPTQYNPEQIKAFEFWNTALLSFRRARALAILVCGKDLRTKLDSTEQLFAKTSSDWHTLSREAFDAIHNALEDVHLAMRAELKID